eukprot:Hpha_TRINITY_DN14932_c0_g1::TRINITY_DN14932_c0_g1_i1::g.143018::m.143018
MGKGSYHGFSAAGEITAMCAGGCGFAVTGVHPTHCCNACKHKGKHGPKCLKKEPKAEEAAAAAPATGWDVEFNYKPEPIPCANGCGFAVTGVTAMHCCRACEWKAGKHGPHCMKKEIERKEPTPPSPEAPAGAKACANGCGFVVTGVTPEHCCRRCAKGDGGHGPGCMKKGVEKNEDPPVAAAPVVKACAKGCGFVVTGVTPEHCCRRCAKGDGGHGGACMKKEVEKNEDPPAAAAPVVK